MSVGANEPDGVRADVLSRLVTISSFLWRRALPSGFPKEFKQIHLDNLSTPEGRAGGPDGGQNSAIEARGGPECRGETADTDLAGAFFGLMAGGAEGNQKQRAGYWLA
jgi:hypothetical protein